VFGGPPDAIGPIEIPVGAAWFPPHSKNARTLYRRLLHITSRATGVRLGHRWLRPTYVGVSDMIATMKSLKRAGVPVWVFMIHSSEIAPCRPLPTEAEVKALVERCEAAVTAAAALGAEPATLIEAGEFIQGSLVREGAGIASI
jgi:sugar phosphate isomerase/epimerase